MRHRNVTFIARPVGTSFVATRSGHVAGQVVPLLRHYCLSMGSAAAAAATIRT